MKLTFFGAAKAVTGSCHCVEVRGKKILIDCGLQQGRDERDNAVFDFSPNYIDYVIVTHAHIDHSGRIPLLIKEGFQGQIFTTRLTGQLLSVMLQDSAHIQEQDAQWKNQKGKRAGRPPVEPLYTVADAAQVAEHLVTAEYGQIIELFEGVKIRFVDAGHLLGSASVEMWMEEGGVEKKIVFSGDIGNVNQPIIRDPSWVHGADYVVMESTYGDRNHAPVASYTAELAKIIDDTFSSYIRLMAQNQQKQCPSLFYQRLVGEGALETLPKERVAFLSGMMAITMCAILDKLGQYEFGVE